MCFNSYFIGVHNWHTFSFNANSFFPDTLSANDQFFYSVCIFIFKNITLDQDNSIGSLCKTLGSIQCKSRMFHYWLALLRKFSHMSSFHYIHPKVTVRAIKRSISQIVVVSFWFFLMILVSSGIIYYLERGYFDEIARSGSG